MHEYPRIPVPAVATLVKRDNHLLTVLRKNPPSQNMWSLPGGKIELGETILQASKREVFEETNIITKPIRPFTAIDAIYYDNQNKIQYHYVIIYVFSLYEGNEIIAKDDIIDAKWIRVDEIERLTFESETAKIIKNWFNVL